MHDKIQDSYCITDILSQIENQERTTLVNYQEIGDRDKDELTEPGWEFKKNPWTLGMVMTEKQS